MQFNTLTCIAAILALGGGSAVCGQAPSSQNQQPRVCPLPYQQQVDAAKAFAAMVPTLETPRCINCHGAVDPYEGTNHVGGAQFTCVTCHTISPGEWQTSPEEMFFTNKDAVQLCRQMKENLPDASSFLAHITEDRGLTPFIQTAFLGTRALNPEGQRTYQQKTGKKYQNQPPPTSHSAFVAQGENWVAAMGGAYRGDSDCGCAPHHYVLAMKLQSQQTENRTQASVQIQTAGQTEIPLQFQADGSFVGDGQMTISLQQALHTQIGQGALTCTTQGTMVMTYKLTGTLDDKAQRLHATMSVGLLSGSTSSICSDGRNFTHTIPPSGLHAGKSFDIPSLIGVVSNIPQPYQNPGEYASNVIVSIKRAD